MTPDNTKALRSLLSAEEAVLRVMLLRAAKMEDCPARRNLKAGVGIAKFRCEAIEELLRSRP